MDPIALLIASGAILALGIALCGVFLLARAVPAPAAETAAEGDTRKHKKNSRLRAVSACAGPRSSARIHKYAGLADCRMVNTVYNGDRYCKDSCVGYGTCRDLCPRGAIELSPDGVPLISDLCDGCGLCVRECPSGALKLVPRSADFYVRCVAKSAPASARSSFCAAACTACGVCENVSPGGGFSTKSGVAVVEYRSHGDRRAAARSCPASCIVALGPDRESEKNALQSPGNGIESTNSANGAVDSNT